MSEQEKEVTDDAPQMRSAWGKGISEVRMRELQSILDAWNAPGADRGSRRGPFDQVEVSDDRKKLLHLTGSDVYWLAEQSGRDQDGTVPNLHLEGADLGGALLVGSDLRKAHLDGAFLPGADLEGANLRSANLEGANLRFTYLRIANFSEACLLGADLMLARAEGADLTEAHLGGANLIRADLTRATLTRARLESSSARKARLRGADLSMAQLQLADLSEADLQGANLSEAHLEGANLTSVLLESALLRGVWFDTKTDLKNAHLDRKTRLGDIQWGGVGAVNLTQIDWDAVSTLGDEKDVTYRSDEANYDRVVRAYRQLATQLRSQGLTEVADRFAYRSNVRQRRLYLRRFRLPRYFGSLLLDLISGYGYRPARSIITYILVICAFAGAYLFNAQFAAPHLTWDEALVLSISSFHGRGFFTSGIALSDTLARLAAGEAVIGLLIEITFIATFTQRFFAR